MEKGIRENPPMSIVSFEDCDTYVTLYDDITLNGVSLEYVDRHALAELALALVEMNRLRKDLIAKGEAMEVQGDKHVVVKRNPSREAIQKLYTVSMKLFAEFKMTPASRGRNFTGKGQSPQTVGDGFSEV